MTNTRESWFSTNWISRPVTWCSIRWKSISSTRAKAIEIDRTLPVVYSNSGPAKPMAGNMEQGLKDSEQAIKLDKKNADAYRNLGLYHVELGNHETALGFLTKAKELEAKTPMIDALIERARQEKT